GDVEARRIADGVGAGDDVAAPAVDGGGRCGPHIAHVGLAVARVPIAAAGRAGGAGDGVSRRIGPEIGVITVLTREAGAGGDAAGVQLGVVDVDVDVVVAGMDLVAHGLGCRIGGAEVIGAELGSRQHLGRVLLIHVHDQRTALVIEGGLVGGGAAASGDVPGVARPHAGPGGDAGARGVLADRQLLVR